MSLGIRKALCPSLYLIADKMHIMIKSSSALAGLKFVVLLFQPPRALGLQACASMPGW